MGDSPTRLTTMAMIHHVRRVVMACPSWSR
jgi:hypothetical protein